MTLTEIRQLLAANGIRLTKSLGQNFLHDKHQLRRIVEAAELTRRDRVIEIGPGLGQLTELLLAEAGTVLAIEKDARLVRVLEERFAVTATGSSNTPQSSGFVAVGESGAPTVRCASGLTLVHADALDFFKTQQADWRRWKLVSNLPFSVASPILVELAQLDKGPSRLVVTVQVEVARRLLAAPATPEYGVLTLLVGVSYAPCRMFKIPAGCFFPQPKVDSACVVMDRRRPVLLSGVHKAVFVQLVKSAFAQRRKMMLKLLKATWPEQKLLAAFDTVGLKHTARAEQASLEQFVQLTRALGDPAKPRMSNA
jgi:16S rRNA (adenine1518-N6/adenine1519-N6)-dimethyltransferase